MWASQSTPVANSQNQLPKKIGCCSKDFVRYSDVSELNGIKMCVMGRHILSEFTCTYTQVYLYTSVHLCMLSFCSGLDSCPCAGPASLGQRIPTQPGAYCPLRILGVLLRGRDVVHSESFVAVTRGLKPSGLCQSFSGNLLATFTLRQHDSAMATVAFLSCCL